jgi:predicted transcriptional regulator of viral defense system
MIVRTADMFGETWLRTHLDNGGADDEIMSAAEAALLVGVKAGTIRKWHERGFIDRVEGGYRRGQVLARKRDLDLVVTEREAC